MQEKVGVVGVGYVGIILAVFLCEKGLQVYGVDKDERISAEINKGIATIRDAMIPELIRKHFHEGKLRVSSDMATIKDTNIVLVTVGTPLGKNYSPDMSAIKQASNELARHLHEGHLVIYKSTVVPGMVEQVVLPILEKGSGLRAGKDFMLAYCPERLGEGSRMTDFTGSALEEVKTLPIIVGGINPQSTDAAVRFWDSLGIDTIKVSSPKVAELAKLADNWWIDLNIAIANELALLCEKMQVDTYEVIEAANTLPKNRYNVNILLPGCGVGGSCLTKDPWFVSHLGRTFGLDLKSCRISREVNDYMPKHMYELIKLALEDLGKNVSNANLSILGLAFKQGTGDTRNSPAIPLIKLLLENGAKIKVFDPLVDDKEARKIAGKHVVGSLYEVLKGTECIVLVNAQPEFRSISFGEIKPLVTLPCAVVDGRRAFRAEEVTEAGFAYWAVGLAKKL